MVPEQAVGTTDVTPREALREWLSGSRQLSFSSWASGKIDPKSPFVKNWVPQEIFPIGYGDSHGMDPVWLMPITLAMP